MKKIALIFVIFSTLTVNNSFSQCGQISMIGEFSSWAEDYFMVSDSANPGIYNSFLYVDMLDDLDENGTIDLKFRQDSSWVINWGNTDFPEGIAVQNGPNIPAPPGNYFVTFNCNTGYYLFQETCGEISMIGEFTDWMDDLQMNRDLANIDLFKQSVTFTSADDDNLDGYVDIKFRENGDWAYNWGGVDFPQGYGIMNGPVLPVPYGSYDVSFNCGSLEYKFDTQIEIDEINPDDENIMVFPNPADEFLCIRFRNHPGNNDCRIIISDLTGRIISEDIRPTVLGKEMFKLDIGHLEPGVYIFKFAFSENITIAIVDTFTRKIVVK